jgi:hypothetical protein
MPSLLADKSIGPLSEMWIGSVVAFVGFVFWRVRRSREERFTARHPTVVRRLKGPKVRRLWVWWVFSAGPIFLMVLGSMVMGIGLVRSVLKVWPG